LRIRRTHSFDALRCAESSIRLPCPLKISIVLHIPMFRRPPVILVSAPSKLRTVNEVSFKQHDKRKVIGSKVNGFPLLALLAIRHRGGWRLEVTAHSQRGRFPSDVGRQTNDPVITGPVQTVLGPLSSRVGRGPSPSLWRRLVAWLNKTSSSQRRFNSFPRGEQSDLT
jgi:hypothetical protein